MTEPTLEELSADAVRTGDILAPFYGAKFMRFCTYAPAPKPTASAPELDAWADYQIARRRYERALIRSRRGVDE